MERTEKTWRCDCGDDHFLSVSFYESDPEGWVSLADGTHCTSLWCRVKSAWKLIRTGAAPHFGIEIILSADNAGEIAEAIRTAGQKIGTPR